jgi:hypothetical protein
MRRFPWEAGPSLRVAWCVPSDFRGKGPKGDFRDSTTTIATSQQSNFTNRIFHGDCIDVIRQRPSNTVDFILTDPPYFANYRDPIQNDVDESWLKPAMAEAYRVLKQDRVVVMFYGWTKVDALSKCGASRVFSLSDTSPSARAIARSAGACAISTSRHFHLRKGDRRHRNSRSATLIRGVYTQTWLYLFVAQL